MKIKNNPPLTLVVNRNEELLDATHHPEKDEEHEDTELCLLVEARNDQDEIEVDMNTL